MDGNQDHAVRARSVLGQRRAVRLRDSGPHHRGQVSEERRSDTGTDTSRYLAAGAARSFWVRTRQGQLHEAMPRVRQLLAGAENCIVESNSILRFLQPDVFVSVLDPAVADFKASALRYLDRADALVMPEGALDASMWDGVSEKLVTRAPGSG